jgi:hypothetical protein
MTTIDLVNLAAVLVALLPAVAIAWALAAWLRRRKRRPIGITVRRGNAACGQCLVSVTGLSHRAARTWARDHAAQYHPDQPAAAIR